MLILDSFENYFRKINEDLRNMETYILPVRSTLIDITCRLIVFLYLVFSLSRASLDWCNWSSRLLIRVIVKIVGFYKVNAQFLRIIAVILNVKLRFKSCSASNSVTAVSRQTWVSVSISRRIFRGPGICID